MNVAFLIVLIAAEAAFALLLLPVDGNLKIYDLPLWDCPVFIMDKADVEMMDATEARKAGSSKDMLY